MNFSIGNEGTGLSVEPRSVSSRSDRESIEEFFYYNNRKSNSLIEKLQRLPLPVPVEIGGS
jgi:hypothetical protein